MGKGGLEAKREIVLGGVKTVYTDGGAGRGSPLILVHGIHDDLAIWEPTVHAFRRQRRVASLDLPGFGGSEKPRIRYTYAFYAECVREFLDRLGIEKAHIAGHSLGGGIMLEFALRHPGRLRSLIIVNGAGVGAIPAPIRLAVNLPHELVLRAAITFPWGTEAAVRRYSLTLVRIPNPVNGRNYHRQREIRRRRELLESELYAMLSIGRDICRRDFRRRAASIRTPTLVVWGAADPFFPLPVGRRMAQKIPGARLAVIPGAGHYPFTERPGEFNRTLGEFLERMD